MFTSVNLSSVYRQVLAVSDGFANDFDLFVYLYFIFKLTTVVNLCYYLFYFTTTYRIHFSY